MSSGYFYVNANNENTSSHFQDNESLKLMFNTDSNKQQPPVMTHSKTSKKRGANSNLFGKNPHIQRIKSSHIQSRQGSKRHNNFLSNG